ncbi:TIGR02757 family protein [Marinilabiliaceae bacterium ANBcel2]|nr:TIGR02757 family protein [Marinilabiliaceae bacterium ANBcel2]
MSPDNLKSFLDQKVIQYNNPSFIESDPISIPHQFSQKEDIEISAFLVASFAWGKRSTILKSGNKLINIMGSSPYDFIMSANEKYIDKLDGFVHRTFNSTDLKYFITALNNIYRNYGGLENVFTKSHDKNSMIPAIIEFNQLFFSIPHPQRTKKHIGNPSKGSAAKKINMFLRWMVRKDRKGVDFGLWNNISPAILSIPLDIHSGNVSRKLGLLTRKQNNIKAVIELDKKLRSFDPLDPVKYDFALFGLGVFENF